MNAKTILVSILVLGLLGFLAWGLADSQGGGLEPGGEVPTASLETLPAGGEGSLADYRGKWVLLNVWASWCVPCREESPALEKFSRQRGDRVTVLGIDTRDLSSDALGFIREFGLTYPQLRDPDGTYADELQTTGVPESFLVDPDGRLVRRLRGPFASDTEITRFSAPALGTKGRDQVR
jgi:cytochrome c biogenesis protein CcmG/thiol:disulfide interchange protein DsbE